MPHDPSDPDQPKTTLPAFTPVPRLKDRSNGWKPEVQRAFIEALAETGSVKAACRRVGRTDNGAYQLRRHPEGEGFRAAWDAALDLGIRRLEDALTERAIHGVEVPVFCFGNLVGHRTVYNDRLGMFMLRNRLPDRYAEGRPRALNAVGKMELERLKKQLRAEWEAERRANQPDIEEIRASILRKVEVLAQADRGRETPRERELREALEAERAARLAREEKEHRERLRAMNPNWRRWEEVEIVEESEEAVDEEACRGQNAGRGVNPAEPGGESAPDAPENPR